MERKGNENFLVKDTREARMSFIEMIAPVRLKNKDEEHLKKYEAMWSDFIEDVTGFIRKYHYGVTADEFHDIFLIMGLASIDRTVKKGGGHVHA